MPCMLCFRSILLCSFCDVIVLVCTIFCGGGVVSASLLANPLPCCHIWIASAVSVLVCNNDDSNDIMVFLFRCLCLHVALCVICSTLILQFCFVRITLKMNAEKQLFLACIIVVQLISHAGRYTVVVIHYRNKCSPKSFWEERIIASSHGRECTHLLCVLLATQCPLQTSLITQPWVCYIHTTVPHASYTLHCFVWFLPPKKKFSISLTGGINPRSSNWNNGKIKISHNSAYI